MPRRTAVNQKKLAEKISILSQVVPFNILGEENLRFLAEKAEYQSFPKDAYVFRQGESSKGKLYTIVSGRTKIVVDNETAGETVAGYRNPFDFFGVTALFSEEEEYPVSVLAFDDLTCLVIDHEDVESIMAQNAEFSSFFTYEICRRLSGLYKSFMEESRESAFITGLPMRKKVSEIMNSPPITCGYMDSIEKVASIMSENDVSSVVVMAPNGNPLGIITEKDLVKKVLAAEPSAGKNLQAHDIMSETLVSIPPHEYSYQALLLMAKHSIKHIVVKENGTLAGIVTMRDLIRSRQSGALSIVNAIETKETVDELKKTVRDIDLVLQALVSERAYASEICPLITEFYDRLTRKIIFLAEQEMTAEHGPPPVKYSFINMGSSGRMEQYSRTDQDNGIIFENISGGKKAQEVQQYFTTLGEKIVSGLEACGFKRCDGHVMANNPEWCHSLSQWNELNHHWIEELKPENIRKMTIFLDFRHIYGDAELTRSLRWFVAEAYRNANTALLFLVEDDLQHRTPLNVFRQIVTEKSGEYRDQVNLKGAACVHIVDCIRLFCLREGVLETSTFKRLAELKKQTVLKKEEIEFIEAAYETLMMFRIREAVEKMSRGEQPSNYISPYKLSKKEQSLLRESFIVVNRLQNLAAKYFRVYQG